MELSCSILFRHPGRPARFSRPPALSGQRGAFAKDGEYPAKAAVLKSVKCSGGLAIASECAGAISLPIVVTFRLPIKDAQAA